MTCYILRSEPRCEAATATVRVRRQRVPSLLHHVNSGRGIGRGRGVGRGRGRGVGRAASLDGGGDAGHRERRCRLRDRCRRGPAQHVSCTTDELVHKYSWGEIEWSGGRVLAPTG